MNPQKVRKPRKRSKSTRPRPDTRRMLAAAEALFADRGFGAVSLRDLITACGCSTTAFYARFEGKEDVFARLIDSLIAELTDTATDRFQQVRSVPDGYTAGIESLVETFLPRKGLVRIALSEGASCPPVRASLHRGYTVLAQLLGAQFQLLGSEDPMARGWGLVGVINIGVLRWAVFEDVADEELAGTIRSLARADLEGDRK